MRRFAAGCSQLTWHCRGAAKRSDECALTSARHRRSSRGAEGDEAIRGGRSTARLALHPRQELGGGRPHPRRASGARHPAEGRQGPGHRRAHHDVGGEAVRAAARHRRIRLAGQRPPLSCRTSPPQGGRLAVSAGFRQRSSATSAMIGEGPACGRPISPLEGEMSGRTEGGNVERRLATFIARGRTMTRTRVPPRNRRNARKMRKVMTDAELKLWNELRAHRLMGLGFRRQVPIAGIHRRLRLSCTRSSSSKSTARSMPRPSKRRRRQARQRLEAGSAGPSCASGTTMSFAISTMSASTSSIAAGPDAGEAARNRPAQP